MNLPTYKARIRQQASQQPTYLCIIDIELRHSDTKVFLYDNLEVRGKIFEEKNSHVQDD